MKPVVDDPLERLLQELLEAHDRMLADELPSATATAARPPGRGRLARGGLAHGRRGRRLVAGLPVAVLILAAAATAAVVLAVSRPLAGRLPPQLLGSSYALRVAPDLRAGHAGWCVSLLDVRESGAVMPVPAECVSGRGALIARGGVEVISPRTGAAQGQLLYAIVSRSVKALRGPGGATVTPIGSSSLPPGWRAAITIGTDLPPARRSAANVATLTPLSAAGTRITSPAPVETVLATRAARAGARPLGGGCMVRVSAGAGVSLGSARALAVPVPRSPRLAGALLSCYSAVVDADGGQNVAAVLIGAGGQSSGAPEIPGFRPLRGGRGVWIGPRGLAPSQSGEVERLLARRAGRGWLLLQTSSSTTMALALLRRISASA